MGCNCKKVNNTVRHENGCDCGPNCSCHDCREKYHGNGMGRYDEYPRPKAAMFDPRKIGQAWPEPNNDPLIPYVRANEQGLPYERLNEYKGMKNSLHGWSAMGGVAELTTVKNAVTNLMNFLSVKDYSMAELLYTAKEDKKSQFHVPKLLRMRTNDVDFQKVNQVSNISTFFAFVPIVRKEGTKKIYELYIRCGGPEVRAYWWDDESIEIGVDAAERDYLKSIDYFQGEWGSYGGVLFDAAGKLLSHSYPIVYTKATLGEGFLSTSDAAYKNDLKSYHDIAQHLICSIVDHSIDILNSNKASRELKKDVKDMLTILIGACINKSNIDDVANGIADSVVKRLEDDYVATELRAFYKFEPETLGINNVMTIDTEAKAVFSNKRATQAEFTAMKNVLGDALHGVLIESHNAMSEVYKQLLNFDNIQEANKKVDELKAQVNSLQANMTSSGSQKDSQIVELQNSVSKLTDDLNRKTQEAQQLASELEMAKSASLQQQAKTRQDTLQQSSTSGMIAKIAVAGALGGAVWYMTNKK